jgi:hypothetical protein
MGVFLAIVVSVGLVGATVLIHYEALQGIHQLLSQLAVVPRRKVLLVIGGILSAHLVEICLYAFAYLMMHHQLDLGSLAGRVQGGWLDFFYFSASTYATLGLGDVAPLGPMRIVAGIEAVNGLVLIGWSTSYTYLTISNSWQGNGGTTV